MCEQNREFPTGVNVHVMTEFVSVSYKNYLLDFMFKLSHNEDFTDVCPLLDRPPGREYYLQPVQVNRNIELVTRNLPAEVYEGVLY